MLGLANAANRRGRLIVDVNFLSGNHILKRISETPATPNRAVMSMFRDSLVATPAAYSINRYGLGASGSVGCVLFKTKCSSIGPAVNSIGWL